MSHTSNITTIPRKRKSWLILAGSTYYGIARDAASKEIKEAGARAWLAGRLSPLEEKEAA
jgi:hypothetical protein